jgi:non-specific serine/threonine protein kinase/serine/threonine-protein kinase
VEKTRQWEKVKELFGAALDREPEQRETFLRGACGDDEALRVEVESLLAAHAGSDDLWQSPWPSEFLKTPPIPNLIGPYHLIEKIGEGGMGQVWLAEQTEPLRRQVVLKLIRAGMYDDSKLRRFQAERQSLAIMDHPAIAKVFDAGATTDGQPYFVMEYVPGEKITSFCDHKKLKVRERLDLFVKVCEGVQHAHQKAIIHRDLKPANILVVELDGKPAPRIIDFGLAKAVEPVAGETLFTQAGGLLGTPGYISPEQADPDCKDIDTRTDVYSLGVLLYELLTGLLPFDTKQWEKKPLYEVMRQLKEQDPPSPSTRVGMAKDSSTSSAEMRGTEPKQLASLLHGDLDWITMKALEKDRARRYGTPSELAADIQRYLINEPVVARPASAGYQLRKYVRRHRIGVAAAAALILLLAGFAGMEAVQIKRITQERDRTARERDRANRIADFATGMFKVSDPSEARGNSVTAREILDKASKNIESNLANDPDMQAQMMFVMGATYQGLGLLPQSEQILRKTLEIQKRTQGPDNAATLHTMLILGSTLMYEGKGAEAEEVERQALDTDERTLGPKNPQTIRTTVVLGGTLLSEGKNTEAEALYRELLPTLRNVLGSENGTTIASMNNLALAETQLANYPQAEDLIRQVLEINKRKLGPDHPETLRPLTNLSYILRMEGRFKESEATAREALEANRRIFGPEHPVTLVSSQYLANAFLGEGRFNEAEKLCRETLGLRKKVEGPSNGETLESAAMLALDLMYQGKYAEAENLDRGALDTWRNAAHRKDIENTLVGFQFPYVLERAGRYSEAETTAREVLEPMRHTWGPRSPNTLLVMNALALALAHEGHNAEAEDLAKQAADLESQVPMPEHVDNKFTSYYLACVAAIEGRHDEAISMLDKAIQKGLWPEIALTLAHDPNLKLLQGDPRFDALVTEAEKRAGSEQARK